MDKIWIDGYDYYFWKYEEQTKMKHAVLEEYLDKWIKILGHGGKLNYIDCFGGGGAYLDNDGAIFYGSPIRASIAIEKNQERLDRSANLVIIEGNKENVENLKKIFAAQNLTVNPIIIEGDFDEKINNLLDRNKGVLFPTFFFIDPFGFKIKLSTLKRIMAIPKSEIFLNFMYTRINEFLTAEKIQGTLSELFGCNDWLHLANSTNRESSIINFYRKKLKDFSRYVYYYRMSFPEKNRTYYYLFHLTNHHLGCSIMKSSFATFNYGKVEYLGPERFQQSLFDRQDIKVQDVQNALLSRYKGKSLSYINIIRDIIDEVPFLEKEVKTALKELRKSQLIAVKPVDSKTNRGLGGKDIIEFL